MFSHNKKLHITLMLQYILSIFIDTLQLITNGCAFARFGLMQSVAEQLAFMVTDIYKNSAE